MQGMSRRRFMYLGLSGGAVGLGAAGCLGTMAAAGPGGLHAVTQTTRAMGATVTITALGESAHQTRRAVSAAMAEVRLIDELMSLYRPESPLCRLNRHGMLQSPDPRLVDILRYASRVSERTQGAFDVTVQPLWLLYAGAKRSGRPPASRAVADAVRNVDWRRVEVAPRLIRLRGPGTQVTLNGIAQGFAADRAVAALREHGVRHALVNTGEIGSLGGKAGGRPWTVGIQHPRQPDAYIELAELRGRCLSTSGDYATRFSDDYQDHHLFDPRTGGSPGELSSVSVAADTAVEADALSTAVFVLGLEQGLRLIAATPGADALLVLKDGRTLATAGFPAGTAHETQATPRGSEM